MRKVFGVELVGALMILSTYAGAGPMQTPFRDTGAVLFGTYCASCHGRNGHGDGPVAENLRTQPPNLTQLAKLNGGMFPAERTRRVIDGREPRVRAHGSLEMP